MSVAEARDAYVAVEVPLPNGKVVSGRPIPWKDAVPLLVLSDRFTHGEDPKDTLVPMLEAFERLTGITEARLLELCPDLALGELIDLVNRFFYWRRPAPIGGPPAPAKGAPGA